MRYDEDDVKAMIKQVESRRAEWRVNAEATEKMWALQPFKESSETYLHQDGIEAIATADPYNIIQLLQRFVSGEPRIEVPYLSASDEDDRRSEKLEQWLIAFWERIGRQQGRNISQDMAWHSGVRGLGALEIQWITDLPKRLQGKRIPISVRLLDGLNVGVSYGPYGAEYGFHKYRASRSYIEQAYPKFKLDDTAADKRYMGRKEYEVVSFWYDDRDSIWHCVTVDGKWAKEPTTTDYPDIPIIEWSGDGAPIDDEAAKHLSLLHPIKDLWPAKSRLLSRIGTGLLYHFEPMYKLINPQQQPWKGEMVMKPGATLEMQGEQDVQVLATDVNVPLAQAMLQIVDTQIQQATFPSVMYGEEGGASSGYAINQLASSARGRINNIRMNLEAALEAANEMVLALVEIFGGDEGVEIWGGGEHAGSRGRPILINASDIKGNYANRVTLVPEIPTDDTQRLMTWSQLHDKGLISAQFLWDRVMNIPVPRDEDLRIAVEQATKSNPELGQKMQLAALRERFKDGDQWRRIIAGTSFEQINQAEEQWIQQQEAEKEARRAAKRREKDEAEKAAALQQFLATGVPPEGWHMMPDGTLMKDGEMSPQGPGQGMPPMMPPGMPPDLGMSPEMLGGGMPPGAMPAMPGPMPGGPPMPPGMGGLPPGMEAQGLPPGMLGEPGLPPELMGGPPGMTAPPGVPPEMAGQMTPEMLGIPPQGGPPGMFQAMQGQPLTDEEIARRLMGPGAGGPPPLR